VVGRVTIRRSGTITVPGEGRYRAHLQTGPEDCTTVDTAIETLLSHLRKEARSEAVAAGAEDIQFKDHRDIRKAQAEGREVFLEAEITIEASGRPRIAE